MAVFFFFVFFCFVLFFVLFVCLFCFVFFCFVFQEEIAMTLLRSGIVMWSTSSKEVISYELTVPWEDNIDDAHKRMLTKYAELRAECYPFKIGCRGFIAFSF